MNTETNDRGTVIAMRVLKNNSTIDYKSTEFRNAVWNELIALAKETGYKRPKTYAEFYMLSDEDFMPELYDKFIALQKAVV
jgi:hypothetical protein